MRRQMLAMPSSLDKSKAGTASSPSAVRTRLLLAALLVGIALAFLAYRANKTLTQPNKPELLTLGDDITFGPPPPLTDDRQAVRQALQQVQALRTIAANSPNDAAAQLNYALAALQNGDLLSAREGLHAVLRLDKQPDPRVFDSLGDCELQLGLNQQGLQTYRTLVQRAPTYARGYIGLSLAQTLNGQREEAAQTLERASRMLAASDLSGHLELANEFERQGNLPRAFTEAQAVYKTASTDSEAIYAVALLQLKLGQIAEARRLLDGLVATRPEDSAARRWLATCVNSPLQKKPDPALAEHLYLEVLQRNRRDKETCTQLGELYQSQGRFKQAACIYTWLLNVAPDSAAGRLQLARAYTRLGDERTSAEQRAIAEKLLQRDREEARLRPRRNKRPADSQTRLALGRHYARAGQFARALPELQAAYNLAPNAPETQRELAAFYRGVGVPLPSFANGKLP